MNDKQLKKYFSSGDFDIQSANANLLICDLVYSSYANSSGVHGIDFSPIVVYFNNLSKNNPHFQLIEEEKIKAVAKNVYQQYLREHQSLAKKISAHDQLTKKIVAMAKDYQKKNGYLINRSSSVYFNKYVKLIRQWWAYGSIGEDHGKIIEHIMIPEFAKRHELDLASSRSIFLALAHPGGSSFINEERLDYLRIARLLKSNSVYNNQLSKKRYAELLKSKIIAKAVFGYVKDYYWSKTDFYQAIEVTPEFVLWQISQDFYKQSVAKIKTEIRTIENITRNIEKLRRQASKKVKLTKQDKIDITFANLWAAWIDRRKVGSMITCYFLFDFLKKLSLHYRLSYQDLTFYNIKDFQLLLSKGKFAGQSAIKQRKVFLIKFDKNWQQQYIYDTKAKKLFDLASKVRQHILKGSVASAGSGINVLGRVSLVLNPKVDKFREGDILVTSMTRIEFVPLMRKASAIITNEGGIACHAAIVSRELGIPCVIGTKYATKILRSGNKVEINVHNGVIRKLQSK